MASKAFKLSRKLEGLAMKIYALGIHLKHADLPDPNYKPGPPQPIYTNDPVKGRIVVGHMPQPDPPLVSYVDVKSTCQLVREVFAQRKEELSELFPEAVEALEMIYFYENGYHSGTWNASPGRFTEDWWALNIIYATLLACVVMSKTIVIPTGASVLAAHTIFTRDSNRTCAALMEKHQEVIVQTFKLTH